ncbi:sensor histidine kinase [Microbacterium trichothecenolyticum]|nr:histidine kinase [Microbacterium trichothecenolyticum]
MSTSDGILVAWWRRLSGESRASMVGAIAIAIFLLLLALATALSTPALSIAVNAVHAAAVLGVGWIFFHCVRVVLGNAVPRRLLVTLLLAGIPVLAAAWLYDWTLGCVWVASTFLVLRGRWALTCLAVTFANLVLALLVLPGSNDQSFELIVSLTLFTIFAIYVPIRLVVVSDGLVLSREEVARLHVDRERSRISRDLHDLLGRTLVAVSMRQQAALRLVELDRAEEAAQQIRAAYEIVAEGQAKLRALTHGPTIADLRAEVTSASELCARIGIEWDAQVEDVGSEQSQRLAAVVIREAVTNMLKYSRPTHCWLRLREEAGMLVLSLANDGCPTDLVLNPAGTGLRELGFRCESVGGTLDARSPRPGIFRVLAQVPTLIDQEA